MRLLLAPDAAASRVQRLEESRSLTLYAATATLQRIERNLHDGTQAQLVALAMRLGQAKEKLDHLGVVPGSDTALETVRHLVDEAHRGTKEAIADLRDLARGIHPPALDTCLANALWTLAARSPVPTEVTVSVPSRPTQTPAIEAICYFCAAELLATSTSTPRRRTPRLPVPSTAPGSGSWSGTTAEAVQRRTPASAPPRAAWPAWQTGCVPSMAA